LALTRPLLLALILTSCVIGSEKYIRPADLAPTWLVDRPRVLGIRAMPAELRPGETARFEALLAAPDSDEPYTVVWIACPVEGGGIGFGCPLDLQALDLETATPEQLAEAGFIGFEPLIPPVYTSPQDFLEELDDDERLEGAYVLVQVTAFPADADVEDTLDFNTIEAAYKRLVVSEASTPNTNPILGELTVEGIAVEADVMIHLDPNQPYEIGIEIPNVAIEEYEYRPSGGDVELRTEEPYVAWFTTGGQLLEEVTLYPNTQADWVSPKRGTSGTWYAVARDRRGGQTWRIQRWTVD
jgi:hypothetical protein